MNDKFEVARLFITSVLKELEPFLNIESIDAVTHYLKHDEYEMAFEGLFLDIMHLNQYPDIDYKQARMIGEDLSLNKESVFDSDFWPRFITYIEKATS